MAGAAGARSSGRAEEGAALVASLLSDEASSSTGSLHRVDGGYPAVSPAPGRAPAHRAGGSRTGRAGRAPGGSAAQRVTGGRPPPGRSPAPAGTFVPAMP
ncbi:MAG TPA: hypothetical protein VER05_08875 [Cellulomonas sp.]|nr:hypothetical protein [Cellulomonas sp.]